MRRFCGGQRRPDDSEEVNFTRSRLSCINHSMLFENMVCGSACSRAANDRVTLREVRTLPVCRTARRALFREVMRRKTRRRACRDRMLVQNAGLCRQNRRDEYGRRRQANLAGFVPSQAGTGDKKAWL